jgi:hypothetical protein
MSKPLGLLSHGDPTDRVREPKPRDDLVGSPESRALSNAVVAIGARYDMETPPPWFGTKLRFALSDPEHCERPLRCCAKRD